MLSTIFSRILFTCSTFLLISASLLSMEFPGREKKADGESGKLPPRSSPEQTELNRRNEEADGRNSDQDLTRSFGDCTLSDPTIVRFQGNNDTNFALQNGLNSSIDNDMNIIGSGEVGGLATTPIKKRDNPGLREVPFVTPTKGSLFENHSIQQVLSSEQRNIITPSPLGKRPITPPSPIAHSIDFTPPAKGPRPRGMSNSSHPSIPPQEVKRAMDHADAILQDANKTIDSFVSIYNLFNPGEFKKLERLSQSLNDITSASTALEIITAELKQLHQPLEKGSAFQQESVDSSRLSPDLFLKLRIATATIQKAIDRAHAAAQALAAEKNNLPIDNVLNDAREIRSLTANLLSQPSILTESKLEATSFPSSNPSEAALKEAVHSGRLILEQKNTLIECVVEPALTVFGATNDYINEDALTAARQKAESMALMLDVAIENAQFHGIQDVRNEKNLPAFDTIRVTSELALQALDEMKKIASRVVDHEDSWPLDVTNILDHPVMIKNK